MRDNHRDELLIYGGTMGGNVNLITRIEFKLINENL
jgi:hypothetical protein